MRHYAASRHVLSLGASAHLVRCLHLSDAPSDVTDQTLSKSNPAVPQGHSRVTTRYNRPPIGGSGLKHAGHDHRFRNADPHLVTRRPLTRPPDTSGGGSSKAASPAAVAAVSLGGSRTSSSGARPSRCPAVSVGVRSKRWRSGAHPRSSRSTSDGRTSSGCPLVQKRGSRFGGRSDAHGHGQGDVRAARRGRGCGPHSPGGRLAANKAAPSFGRRDESAVPDRTRSFRDLGYEASLQVTRSYPRHQGQRTPS